MFQKRGIDRNIDWITFSLYLALVMLGWLMIYSVGYEEGQGLFELNSPAGKQGIWVIISFATLGILFLVDWKFWQTFAYPIYLFTLLLLLGLPFLGTTIRGATSWYSLAGFTIQPSEFAKFGTCLALASYLSSTRTNLKLFSHQLGALGIFLAPVALILLQPDLGSALVFFSFLVVLYREGLPGPYYAIGAALGVLLILGLVVADPRVILMSLLVLSLIWLSILIFEKKPLYIGVVTIATLSLWWVSWQEIISPSQGLLSLAGLLLGTLVYYGWKHGVRIPALLLSGLLVGSSIVYGANYFFNNVLKPHQQDRINVWLQPEKCDPRGSLYNLIQAKMAISSGGVTGKGLLNGTMTRLDYVPQQLTDFIFTTIGEEQGFVGVVLVIGLFLFFLIQIIRLAERQRSPFSRIYAYSLAGIIFVHVFINIGMNMGLAPVIGIPLPFISKGGSSLLGFTIMLGVLLKFDSKRFQL
jgi:rod shape determining protein RodA